MNNIPEIEKIFTGTGKKKETTTTEELIKMAKKKGIKTPKNY
jgi:hypothetical protein